MKDEPVSAAGENEAPSKAEPQDAAPAAAAAPAPAEAPTANKGKNARRKSVASESKAKGLTKKASKTRLTHLDAKPGDHFLVKLKGFPAWPAIICDESMLPAALINTRPVSAARPDGSYAEAYAQGGKRTYDRTFPVMYLYTNEFGWVQNTMLSELTAEKAKDSVTDKMRKDLRAAFELAAEHHAVDHYKQILENFEQEQIAQEEAKKQAAATPKKSKKAKTKATEDDDDVEMEDADAPPKSAKSKKRKADETNTPQRSDSVKKPKIKLNTSSTPKAANGAATPKSGGGAASKTKSKPKKSKDGADKKADTAKEPSLDPEVRHARKEKEVLYLRHKLQRGLLTREQQPREEEMKTMSDFISMLENFKDLEVSIIRITKINKVLKAILKLESIPRESEFEFKKRSQKLLDKWNKLLAGEPSAPPSASTNGINGSAGDDSKSDKNGVKSESDEQEKGPAETDKSQEDQKIPETMTRDEPANKTNESNQADDEAKTADKADAATEPIKSEV
ncbi:hypothetical protein CDD81_1853 [Ophiocordyceps australis]|uniref:PWWP domain-containing protein n=1 Tax=Ophiocordyceps australis TaxID=1399860 RepID=A0A2C5XV45_9HYPO|nr:hypothetical protein CDD81_1853 [Ophiocordyceps australis]